MFTDSIGGRQVEWRLERDSRLKRIYMNIHPQEGIVIRTPPGVKESALREILKTRGEWLVSCLDEIASQCPRRAYRDGDRIPFLQEEKVLKLFGNCQHGPYARMEGEHIAVYSPAPYIDREEVRDCLASLYRDTARVWFPLRAAELNEKHFGRDIKKVTVKNQARILGSCSSLGNLNFNWRLLLAPADVVDYVIIHELAHLQEMNHSKHFWRVVETACPDYRRHRAWLRAMNRTLYI